MTDYISTLIFGGVLIFAFAIFGIIFIGKDFKGDKDVRGWLFIVGIVLGACCYGFILTMAERTLCSVQDVLNDNVTWEYKIVDGEKIDSILVKKK